MPSTLTLKQLHAKTGAHVRRAGAARVPVLITDRGQPVAVLASPSILQPRRRLRTLLPDYVALLKKKPSQDVLEDLAAVRGDR